MYKGFFHQEIDDYFQDPSPYQTAAEKLLTACGNILKGLFVGVAYVFTAAIAACVSFALKPERKRRR